MDPQAFQRLHPKTYLERFIAEGIRPDGREPTSWRNVSVNAGTYVHSYAIIVLNFLGPLTLWLLGSITTADGSALARIGDTTVVCGIKAEIAEPNIMTPNDGYIGELDQGYLPARRWLLTTALESSQSGSFCNMLAQIQAWATRRRSSSCVSTNYEPAFIVCLGAHRTSRHLIKHSFSP